jgi:hypothetical protein
MPVQAQRPGQPLCLIDLPVGHHQPTHRRPQVRVLRPELGQPLGLGRSTQPRLGPFTHGQEERGVRRVHRRRFAGVAELAGRVLPQRLQHAVPGVTAGPVGNDQRLPNQPLQQLHHPLHRQFRVSDDGLGGGQGPPAAEHRQPTEQHPLLLREQVVAPIHRAPQGPLPRLGRAVAGGQHREPVPHPVGQLERLQSGQPGGRQFQGQGNAVQPAANHGDRIKSGAVEGQVGADRGRAVQEQPGRRELRDPLGWALFRGDRQRRDRELNFAGHGERLAAGRQDPHQRAALQDGLHQPGDWFDQVLAVVQHNQHVPAG